MSAHDEPCFLFPPTFPETVLESGVCISGMKVMVVSSMIRRRQAFRLRLSMSPAAKAMLKRDILSGFTDQGLPSHWGRSSVWMNLYATSWIIGELMESLDNNNGTSRRYNRCVIRSNISRTSSRVEVPPTPKFGLAAMVEHLIGIHERIHRTSLTVWFDLLPNTGEHAIDG